MASTDTTEEKNKQVVRDFHKKVLTEKNLEAVEDLVAEDYTEHNPAFPEGVMSGRENLVDFWRGLFEAFPDLSITEEDILTEGDTVVTRHVGRGTHEGGQLPDIRTRRLTQYRVRHKRIPRLIRTPNMP
ncbi:MAG: ester cyclase, partial [Halobacteria archaeon]|nr:ester cyclase [Halobacteria archaeon]